jgi:hypothetical protein
MRPQSLMSDGHLDDLEAIVRETPSGHEMAEVGVFKGGSAWFIAKVADERGVKLHLFDTFSGIPIGEPDDSNHIGEFDAGGPEAVAAALPNAILHVGIFPDTLPPSGMETLSFVHSDCDQYYSVRAVIDLLWPRIVPGGVIAFDDMDTHGGQKAIRETFPLQTDGEFTGQPPIHQHRNWWIVRKPG